MGYINKNTGEIVEWNTQFEKVLGGSEKEESSDEVLTIPDKSFKVQEILEKFTRGIKIIKPFEGTYDSGDFDDLNPFENPDFDLSDVTAIEEAVTEYRKMLETTKVEKEANVAESNGENVEKEANVAESNGEVAK